ncbi:MAG: ferritin [Pseudomonadota bacterium]
MIRKDMQDALNTQVNAELYSSYLYLSMSSWFQSINLPGCANWMRVQAMEELVHATKMFDFVIGRSGRAILGPVEGPATEWSSPLDAFEAVYRHEQKVTGLINALADKSLELKDHATNIFLQWFVTEQVEEEASADEIVQRLKLIKGSPDALFMLDKDLGARVFTPPAAEGK